MSALKLSLAERRHYERRNSKLLTLAEEARKRRRQCREHRGARRGKQRGESTLHTRPALAGHKHTTTSRLADQHSSQRDQSHNEQTEPKKRKTPSGKQEPGAHVQNESINRHRQPVEQKIRGRASKINQSINAFAC